MSKELAETRSNQTILKTLTQKERLYVDARLNGSLPVPAARMAGYHDADNEANRLENDIKIRGAMEAAIRVKTHELQYTRQDVLAGFMDAVRMSVTATEMVAAWREIAKIEGHYAPLEVNVNHSQAEKMRTYSDEQLAAMASEGSVEGDVIDAEFVELED